MDTEELIHYTAYMALHIHKYRKEKLGAEEKLLGSRFTDMIIYLNGDGKLGNRWSRVMDSLGHME
ncbi:hypothetical protein FCMLKIFP_00057 [Pseudomonas phage Ka3]|uniref:Uncharacterized protein n=2 Tax=Luzseptimavirus KPP21 TaxID=1982595 RepID=A0A7S6B6E6_9CAUD|nr:hypothetical protein AVU12_gp038 [Pseudomonas phage KPP21]QKE56002.1 hypothetical protein AMP2_gp054 [Pseudomonas phage vB_Pae_AM.P2]QWY17742.1 hypothetical protein [Pseudomonas phage vB_Pae-PA152]UGL60856.1 hypothetical protein [Pseudomonas phage vB_PaeS_TUMS_P6]UNI71939.1 hypothetical protein [Pseudomonas phage vB_PaeP_TUMS_P10]WQZ52407.1 hypothetical protein FCMLKIFP_00057 [Pseudomonas phage Ka3]